MPKLARQLCTLEERDAKIVVVRSSRERMEQSRRGKVQAVLLETQRRESVGLGTVQAVATHFGFSSRNHFARDYRQLFGEAPSETLQRSATPGIRSHPVSVAHRPQMAMARR